MTQCPVIGHKQTRAMHSLTHHSTSITRISVTYIDQHPSQADKLINQSHTWFNVQSQTLLNIHHSKISHIDHSTSIANRQKGPIPSHTHDSMLSHISLNIHHWKISYLSPPTSVTYRQTQNLVTHMTQHLPTFIIFITNNLLYKKSLSLHICEHIIICLDPENFKLTNVVIMLAFDYGSCRMKRSLSVTSFQ